MTRKLFFDNDCLSAFLWVKNESILTKLYPGRIVIPKPVYVELSHPSVQHLKQRMDKLIINGDATLQEIQFGSKEWKIYSLLTGPNNPKGMLIGKGEAASIALAKEYKGILASNNLKDINYYIQRYKLKHITTADIMLGAYNERLITEKEAEQIWQDMLSKRRKLGYYSFKELLKEKK